MPSPTETLFLAGGAFWVAGVALLDHPQIAGGIALGWGIVAVLRSFWLAGAA